MKEYPLDRIRLDLSYDPESGIFRWLGKARTGMAAGWVRNDGYFYICWERNIILAHRLAWAMHFGEWPTCPLDHASMDRTDNRIANLRLSEHGENNRNRSVQRNNSTGFKGVRRSGKRWSAWIRAGVEMRLGSFDTAQEAAHAYNRAAVEYHGEFARLNPIGEPKQFTLIDATIGAGDAKS